MPELPDTVTSPFLCIVDERWHDATVIISCAGVIDMATVPNLSRRVANALQLNPKSMILDLTFVDLLSANGMGFLVRIHDLCWRAIGFTVVANGPATLRPMHLVGLTDIITVRATLADALNEPRG